MATLKVPSLPKIQPTGAISADTDSVSGNMDLIQSQINQLNNTYINVRNAVKILDKYENWKGYLKLFTEIESNFTVGDTVYITYTEPTIDSGVTFNAENPNTPFADFFVGYKVLYTNIYKNEVVINRYYNDVTPGLNLDNQYLSKVSCRGGDFYGDVADGVVFYDCNIFNGNFADLSGVVSGSTISGAIIRTAGLYTVSDVDGNYLLRVPIGSIQLKCSANGYITKTETISVDETMTHDILMTAGSNSISISASTSEICIGQTVNFTSIVVGYDGAVDYKWKINGINVGTNNPNLAYNSFINGDVVTCEVWDDLTGSTSNSIQMTVYTAQVNPISDLTFCDGDGIDGIAFTTINSGLTTIYTWTNNKPEIGLALSGVGNIPAFIATNSGLTNKSTIINATITVTPMISGNTINCIGGSETFIISVRSKSLVIGVSPSDHITAGQTVTFTAYSSCFQSPTYQWKKTNLSTLDAVPIDIGTNSPTLTTNIINNHDVFTCHIGSYSSNSIVMYVTPVNPWIRAFNGQSPESQIEDE